MLNRSSSLTIIAIAVLLSACQLGPNYQRPDVAPPAAWSAAAHRAFEPALSSHAEAAPYNSASWWAILADPTLDELLRRAAAQNLDVQQTVTRIGIAREQRNVAAAALFPTVNGSALGARARLGTSGLTQSISGGQGGAASMAPLLFNIFEVGFDSTWELDLFGKTRRNIEAADATLRSAEQAQRDSLLSMNAEIVRTYFTLRGDERKRDIVAKDVAAQERLGKLVASRRGSGLSASSDVAAQEGQTAASRAMLPQLEQGIAQSLNQLALLLALPPGMIGDLIKPGTLPSLPAEVPVGLPSELLERRPDVREREADLASATAQIGVAKAALFPSIQLGLTAGLQSSSTSKLFDWASRFAIGGSQISVPIFQGGKLVSQVRLAQWQAQQAALAYREAVLNAFHDVDNSLIAYSADQRRESDVRKQLEQSNRSARLTLSRYESGLAAYTDVLTATRQVLQAEQTLADAQLSDATDLVALFKALGGGWDYPGATAQNSK